MATIDNLKIINKALKDRYPITPTARVKMVQEATNILEGDYDADTKTKAINVLAKLDALNLKYMDLNSATLNNVEIELLSDEQLEAKIKELENETGFTGGTLTLPARAKEETESTA